MICEIINNYINKNTKQIIIIMENNYEIQEDNVSNKSYNSLDQVQ